MKWSAITDHLAETAIKDYESLDFDFLDKDVLVVEEEKERLDWWTMYFNGTVNVCSNKASVVIISPNKKQYPVSIKL